MMVLMVSCWWWWLCWLWWFGGCRLRAELWAWCGGGVGDKWAEQAVVSSRQRKAANICPHHDKARPSNLKIKLKALKALKVWKFSFLTRYMIQNLAGYLLLYCYISPIDDLWRKNCRSISLHLIKVTTKWVTLSRTAYTAYAAFMACITCTA